MTTSLKIKPPISGCVTKLSEVLLYNYEFSIAMPRLRYPANVTHNK